MQSINELIARANKLAQAPHLPHDAVCAVTAILHTAFTLLEKVCGQATSTTETATPATSGQPQATNPTPPPPVQKTTPNTEAKNSKEGGWKQVKPKQKKQQQQQGQQEKRTDPITGAAKLTKDGFLSAYGRRDGMSLWVRAQDGQQQPQQEQPPLKLRHADWNAEVVEKVEDLNDTAESAILLATSHKKAQKALGKVAALWKLHEGGDPKFGVVTTQEVDGEKLGLEDVAEPERIVLRTNGLPRVGFLYHRGIVYAPPEDKKVKKAAQSAQTEMTVLVATVSKRFSPETTWQQCADGALHGTVTKAVRQTYTEFRPDRLLPRVKQTAQEHELTLKVPENVVDKVIGSSGKYGVFFSYPAFSKGKDEYPIVWLSETVTVGQALGYAKGCESLGLRVGTRRLGIRVKDAATAKSLQASLGELAPQKPKDTELIRVSGAGPWELESDILAHLGIEGAKAVSSFVKYGSRHLIVSVPTKPEFAGLQRDGLPDLAVDEVERSSLPRRREETVYRFAGRPNLRGKLVEVEVVDPPKNAKKRDRQSESPDRDEPEKHTHKAGGKVLKGAEFTCVGCNTAKGKESNHKKCGVCSGALCIDCI